MHRQPLHRASASKISRDCSEYSIVTECQTVPSPYSMLLVCLLLELYGHSLGRLVCPSSRHNTAHRLNHTRPPLAAARVDAQVGDKQKTQQTAATRMDGSARAVSTNSTLSLRSTVSRAPSKAKPLTGRNGFTSDDTELCKQPLELDHKDVATSRNVRRAPDRCRIPCAFPPASM